MTEQAARHVEWWDWLRLVALLDIVGFHLRLEHPLWGIGLPVFLLMGALLAANRRPPRDTAGFVRVRAERLLVPFVFWSGVFGAYLLLRALYRSIDLDAVFDWRMLLGGTMVHLWFLPFIAVACIAGHFVDRGTQRVPLPIYAALALAAALALLAFLPLRETAFPFAQWAFSLPAIPLAFGLGRVLAHADEHSRAGAALYLAAFVLLALVFWSQVDPDTLDGAARLDALRRYALSLALIVVALCLPPFAGALGAAVSPLLLGMYVLHPPIQHQIIARIEALAGRQLPWAAAIALVALLSAAAVWGLRRTPLRRFV